jgi:PhoPQ-activated pathogenicity-related protein
VTRIDSAEVWSRLLPLIATGASLPAALRQLPEPRPSLWWCKMAVRNDPDLAERYRAAQELRADALADEIVALADEPMPAGLQGTEASAWVQQMRLRVDARKWTASRLFPRQWGDRVEVGVDVSAQISIATALEAANARVERLQQVEIVEEEPSRARIG